MNKLTVVLFAVVWAVVALPIAFCVPQPYAMILDVAWGVVIGSLAGIYERRQRS